MNTKVMFSSNSNEWTTPDDLYQILDSEFHFTLDAASTDENAKCPRHFTAEDNGLEQNWGGASVFCNPPYGKEIGLWVRKAYEESRKSDTKVVLLIPARTDTRYFHDYILGKASEIRLIRGRVHFGDGTSPAPFPSMVVVYDTEHIETRFITQEI